MFRHNFLYSLRILFRNRSVIFWIFAFPILLAVLFYMAFSNLESSEAFQPIDIAVVRSAHADIKETVKRSGSAQQVTSQDAPIGGQYAAAGNGAQAGVKVKMTRGASIWIFEHALAELGKKDDRDRIFNIRYTTKTKAAALLENEEIAGYVLSGVKPKVCIRSNGVEQTILKSAVDEILVDADLIENASVRRIRRTITRALRAGEAMPTTAEIRRIYRQTTKEVLHSDTNIRDITERHLDYTMCEFYTLMAMLCLYGGTVGLEAIGKHLPDQDARGRRTGVSCAAKSTLLFSSALASWLVQAASLALTYAFTVLVLKIDYGADPARILLLTAVGSLAGLAFGAAVGCLLKMKNSIKDSLVVLLTMAGCFFAGMMGPNLKYMFDQQVPLLNRLNPAAMITDGYYSLYCCTGFARYNRDLFSLLLFAAVMLALAVFGLRRQRYDSV
jgi:ABC-2 type transport system permease protein